MRFYMKGGYTPLEIVVEWRKRPAGTPRRHPLFTETHILAAAFDARVAKREYAKAYYRRRHERQRS
jgi:hypothetical protein